MRSTPSVASLWDGSSSGLPFLPTSPPNLPDSGKHPVILVNGLEAWFKSLTAEYARVFLRYLYNFDPDQQSPAPGLYTRAVETAKLLSVYDMATVEARTAFVKLVVWRGAETDPTPPPFTAGLDDGWCYLRTVVTTSRDAMSDALGFNPWAPGIANYLLARPGEWSADRFRLSWGHEPVSPEGPAYSQGHIERFDQGLKVRELIPLLTGWARVGAATGDKMALAVENTAVVLDQLPTVFDDKPKASSMTITLGMYAKVAIDKPFSWTPFKTPGFVIMLGIYESVRLESAVFQLSVPSGQGNEGYAAITSTNTSLSGSEWYGAPVLKMFPGSDNGAVMGTFALPANHSWNKELRGVSLGNSPPEFKFGITGTAGVKLIVTGQFTVSVAGQAVMGALNANEGAKFATNVRRIQGALGYSVVESDDQPIDESDDESDDGEDAIPEPIKRAASSATSAAGGQRAASGGSAASGSSQRPANRPI